CPPSRRAPPAVPTRRSSDLSGVLERGLLLKLRFGFDHFVNLRPTRLFPGVSTPLAGPGEVDFLVVREGTEGPYVGNGGSMRTGTDRKSTRLNSSHVSSSYAV